MASTHERDTLGGAKGSRLQDDIGTALALAQVVNRNTEVGPLLQEALPLVAELVGAECAWAYLLDEEGRFRLAAVHDLPQDLTADGEAALRWTPCRCQQMLLDGQFIGPANIIVCDRQPADKGPAERGERSAAGTRLRVHASVPLHSFGRAVGLVNIARVGTLKVDARGTRILSLVARTLGAAIERASLQRKAEAWIRERDQRLSCLASHLLGLSRLEDIADRVFALLQELLETDSFSLLVVDPSGTYLDLVAARGWAEEYIGRLQFPLHPPGSSGVAWALHVRLPILTNVETAPFTVPQPVLQAGVRTTLYLPLLSGESPIGVLVANFFRERSLTEELMRSATLVARLAAAAIARVQEYQRYRLLFERVPVALYRTSVSGQVLDANEAMVRLLAYPDKETLLRTNAVQFYARPQDRQRWQRLMERQDTVVDFEVRWRRLDGALIWVRETSRAIRDATGRPVYYEGFVEDITDRKEREAQIAYLASHDPLTGCFNRRRFREELEHRLAQSSRLHRSGALLLIDLDNFKEINDSLGHKAGDDILCSVVRQMKATLRATDALGRLGGDEFGVLLFPAEADEALAVAERLLRVVRQQEVLAGGRPFRLSASCGIVIFPRHGSTADELLVAADLALYSAKREGGSRAKLHDGSAAEIPGLDWSRLLQMALDAGRLAIYAQPILHLRTGRVDRYELLARIVDENGVVLSAKDFLQRAERAGLVGQIDRRVWQEALAAARSGRFTVHVNLSVQTLQDQEAIHEMAAEMEAAVVRAGALVVELPESASSAITQQVVHSALSLNGRGCRLALDDFGAGYCVFPLLRRLPLDSLKVDASLVQNVAHHRADREITRAIVSMARAMGLSIIAEGVEDEVTLQAVRELGFDYAQGYHVGRPAPLHQLWHQ